MSFKISRDAADDLRIIGRYTQRRWGKVQRRKYLNALNEKFHTLAKNPLICREREEYRPPVRIYKYQSHLIVYIVEYDHILIVRVLHDSMDVDSRLRQ